MATTVPTELAELSVIDGLTSLEEASVKTLFGNDTCCWANGRTILSCCDEYPADYGAFIGSEAFIPTEGARPVLVLITDGVWVDVTVTIWDDYGEGTSVSWSTSHDRTRGIETAEVDVSGLTGRNWSVMVELSDPEAEGGTFYGLIIRHKPFDAASI